VRGTQRKRGGHGVGGKQRKRQQSIKRRHLVEVSEGTQVALDRETEKSRILRFRLRKETIRGIAHAVSGETFQSTSKNHPPKLEGEWELRGPFAHGARADARRTYDEPLEKWL